MVYMYSYPTHTPYLQLPMNLQVQPSCSQICFRRLAPMDLRTSVVRNLELESSWQLTLNPEPWILPPLCNSWLIFIVLIIICIVFIMTPVIDCDRVGSTTLCREPSEPLKLCSALYNHTKYGETTAHGSTQKAPVMIF